MRSLTVGFIGLGLMGSPMAKNILKKGFPLIVYNRTAEKTKDLQKLGAKVARTPFEVAQNSDVVITMVTAGKDVEEVLFGKNGVANKNKNQLIVIDMSTIGKTSALEISKKLKKRRIDFIDAPVTGSTPKAISGELTIFIGGEKNIYEKMKPVLSAMGTNLCYMGKVGNGQAMKLINNHLVASTITALAEGIILGEIMGLSKKDVGKTLETVPAVSTFMKLKLPNFIANSFPLLFSANNMKKDLTLALLEAKKGKRNLPILTAIELLYQKALQQDLGNKDMSTIIKVIK